MTQVLRLMGGTEGPGSIPVVFSILYGRITICGTFTNVGVSSCHASSRKHIILEKGKEGNGHAIYM